MGLVCNYNNLSITFIFCKILYYTIQLHKGHPGIDATKRRANECMYWNKMYTQLEEAVKSVLHAML